jgi:hypothetical protein
VHKHLKSAEFREKLIVDYLNVLNDQKEFLELRKIKLTESLPESKEPLEHKNKKLRIEKVHYKLKELNSEESNDHLVKLQSDSDQQMHESIQKIESINEYIEIITNKVNVGNQILSYVEKL